MARTFLLRVRLNRFEHEKLNLLRGKNTISYYVRKKIFEF